jgi:hypothetical protein
VTGGVNRPAPAADQEADGSKPNEASHLMEPAYDDPTLSEIHRLEQELENLAARYSALLQSALWLQRGFVFFAAVLIGLMAVGVVIRNPAFVATMALPLLVIGAIALIGPRGMHPWLPGGRWIDAVGWKPVGYYGAAVQRSEAMAVEDMIAERTQRLAILRADKSA